MVFAFGISNVLLGKISFSLRTPETNSWLDLPFELEIQQLQNNFFSQCQDLLSPQSLRNSYIPSYEWKLREKILGNTPMAKLSCLL
ncbi:hypothetical protein CEXT_507151 [Caerostris extrusa]|uniref:Uncharacterized protein n=1 Tax=Caerostris extrusa TaxID=172846 RepID=A0AAV4URY7_CAEEX|nr:hypothetical protein CEXT_507151 [Caerostris extrusa]